MAIVLQYSEKEVEKNNNKPYKVQIEVQETKHFYNIEMFRQYKNKWEAQDFLLEYKAVNKIPRHRVVMYVWDGSKWENKTPSKQEMYYYARISE